MSLCNDLFHSQLSELHSYLFLFILSLSHTRKNTLGAHLYSKMTTKLTFTVWQK